MAGRKKVDVMVEESSAISVREEAAEAMETSCSGEDFNPELAEILYGSLGHWMDLGGVELDAELRKLEGKYRNTVYSEMIYLLSHLRFPGGVARGHWREIVALRGQMEGKLGSPVDVRVALASYFVHVNRKILNPKMVELQLFEQSRGQSYRDTMTGLPNYRFFSESLDREILRSRRSNRPMSLVMVDVDDLKSYNDRHGREAGNVVLAEVARLLSGSLREDDIIARYGGEQFALILPATPKPGARFVAERARAAIERRDIPHEGSAHAGRLTVSMGIATYPADGEEASTLVRSADRALYEAKGSGKNVVHLYGRNRRSFSRVAAALAGKYRSLAEGERPMTTLDISEGGIRFHSGQDLAAGSLLEIEIEPAGGTRPVTAVGRVVQCVPARSAGYECSVRIVALETQDRIAYHRCIAELQQKSGGQRGEGSA